MKARRPLNAAVQNRRSWARFRLDIPAEGNDVVHARVWWADVASNSFLCAWDTDATQVLADNALCVWHWTRSPPARLRPGMHTLILRNREERAALDFLVVERKP